jgi:uncharacterized protein YdhG (YjbR/CyaY superfamily)
MNFLQRRSKVFIFRAKHRCMTSTATTPQEYFDTLPEDRRHVMSELRKVIKQNLPKGFEEAISYGSVGYVVPHSIYPGGYHCDPKLPLPFLSIASQKNFIAVYHMGIYASPELLEWFTTEFPKHSKAKLDMGKSCIRFKKPEHIPFNLIGELVKKMELQEWIRIYESHVKR